MRAVEEFQIGLMFWSTGKPDGDIDSVLSFGIHAGQLGIPGELNPSALEQDWAAALAKHPHFSIATAVCAYAGEDYSDINSVRRTVGFTPPGTRSARLSQTKAVSDLAAVLGIGSLACHIGFVPEDRADPEYSALCSVVREVCDHTASHQQTFALETGQERAHALLTFIDDVARTNLKINFDPANMILYGMGDPIDALHLLSGRVVSVHCKDGIAPAGPGQLGTETRLGSGQVDFPAFIATLRSLGYKGILSIERESPDPAVRAADIRHAVAFLKTLV